eukprot:CAMPEP_0172445870 /NCGR_PEP_ID=MMETSP1065-20121228/5648_1 /TAXON_ID=265537 /ORGANISM="Amphiprora paludosa, Strain CCMP125" /LENGTH=575 /DNA_ID=CAMNT_0013196883 /DNA_START=384 /DNA_END=2111 /DNA_ORIENTATION=-
MDDQNNSDNKRKAIARTHPAISIQSDSTNVKFNKNGGAYTRGSPISVDRKARVAQLYLDTVENEGKCTSRHLAGLAGVSNGYAAKVITEVKQKGFITDPKDIIKAGYKKQTTGVGSRTRRRQEAEHQQNSKTQEQPQKLSSKSAQKRQQKLNQGATMSSTKRSRPDAEDPTKTDELQLGWSDKQRRILTANGKAAEYYTAERGFPFSENELPHYWLSRGDKALWETFSKWKQESHKGPSSSVSGHQTPQVVGAWKRPLFYGGWEHSSNETEHVFNVQTNTLFVDLRLPVTRLTKARAAAVSSPLEKLTTGHELRVFARQHCFAGFSYTQSADAAVGVSKTTSSGFDQVCARHHWIDWNYVGAPRNRPNKWWIELQPNSNSKTECETQEMPQQWKEWAFATDECGQQYYCERWERLSSLNASSSPLHQRAVLALHSPGGIIVVAHNHFNFCLGQSVGDHLPSTDKTSLTEIVDDFVAQGEFDKARQWLGRIRGGHGTVSSGWEIDAAIEFWMEGQPFWSRETVELKCSRHQKEEKSWWESCTVTWNEQQWQLFECNLESFEQLQEFFDLSFSPTVE